MKKLSKKLSQIVALKKLSKNIQNIFSIFVASGRGAVKKRNQKKNIGFSKTSCDFVAPGKNQQKTAKNCEIALIRF
jgi:hypothetical protein